MENKADINAPVKAGPHRWKPGESGNPRGMRPGSRHKASLLAESLIDGETDRLTRRCIYEALKGDMQAMKLCLERLLPPVKSRPINFKLPTLRTVSDALTAITMIVQGVTAGAILADEAETLTGIVGVFIKALEVGALEDRLTALEKANAPPEGRAYDA